MSYVLCSQLTFNRGGDGHGPNQKEGMDACESQWPAVYWPPCFLQTISRDVGRISRGVEEVDDFLLSAS
jgi:hypothetical protein